MKTSLTVFTVLSSLSSTVVLAQATSASDILLSCGQALQDCETVQKLGGATCVSNYLSCIAPNDNCGCQTASEPCVLNPPTGNIVDCGTDLATCVANCNGTTSGNTTTTSSASAVYSGAACTGVCQSGNATATTTTLYSQTTVVTATCDTCASETWTTSVPYSTQVQTVDGTTAGTSATFYNTATPTPSAYTGGASKKSMVGFGAGIAALALLL